MTFHAMVGPPCDRQVTICQLEYCPSCCVDNLTREQFLGTGHNKCLQEIKQQLKHTTGLAASGLFVPVPISSPSVDWQAWFGLLFNGTFSTHRLYRAIEVQCISRRAEVQHNHTTEQRNNRINQENHTHSSAWAFGDDPLAMVRLPQRSLSRQSLGKYSNLTQTAKTENTYQQKTNTT